MDSNEDVSLSRPVGRPRIGVKVDFRVPDEVDAEIRRYADRMGIGVDPLYREIVIAGLTLLRPRKLDHI